MWEIKIVYDECCVCKGKGLVENGRKLYPLCEETSEDCKAGREQNSLRWYQSNPELDNAGWFCEYHANKRGLFDQHVVEEVGTKGGAESAYDLCKSCYIGGINYKYSLEFLSMKRWQGVSLDELAEYMNTFDAPKITRKAAFLIGMQASKLILPDKYKMGS